MSKSISGPVVLIVLDGWGLRQESSHNGVALAKHPTYDRLTTTFPFTTLQASGEAVGLPDGQMGNSEVGHTTIGAGTVLYQDLVRIGKDAREGKFGENKAFQQAFDHVLTRKSTLHVIGLLSAGGVHSHEDHFIEVINAAKKAGIESITLHPFLDGRDTPKTSGTVSLKRLEDLVARIGGVHIGSVSGRYYAMDRDTNWDRTQKAFDAIFNGKADHVYEHSVMPSALIAERYHEEIFDELMEPFAFTDEDGNAYEVRDGDAIIFTNFRSDRAKQLSSKIASVTTDKDLCFVTMANYGSEIVAEVAYTPQEITTTLGAVISEHKMHQVRIAETEKYPHATYFFNGGRQVPYEGEEDVLIPSRKDIKTHDQAPEMRAKEIADAAREKLATCKFMFINFANPDMVGHTANEAAIITAIETVDRELTRVVEKVQELHGALVIIADHGNAEMTVDPTTNEPHTSHTTNPVPCILVSDLEHVSLRTGGGLKDIAPTVLDLLGISKPESMTGTTLVVR